MPLLAQVTAIADVYDALTSDRPYRRAVAPEVALEILAEEARSGKRDLMLVNEFASMVDVTTSTEESHREFVPATPAA